jgi:DNA-binding CsgD family transcriptional regulator/tetratricopeptide (TPR) repeat protein
VPVLLERDAELDRLSGLVRRAGEGQGSVVVIEGPPGIGKTRLGEEAAALARGEGVAVLSASGSELEQEFGFGVVRQLFEPVLANADEGRFGGLFEGAAGLAAPALGLESDTPPLEGQDARFPVVHGLYWLTANLAGQGGVLLWVDDLQWVDRPSQRFVSYLSRRLADLSALLLMGLRPALPGQDRAEIDAIVSARNTLLLEPGPLSVEAVAILAERRFGSAPDRAFAEECRRVTGGNALLVEELLSELGAAGAPADAATVRALGTTGVERVGRGVKRRLDLLPSSATKLAQAVEVLGDGCSLEAAAGVAGLAEEDAVHAAEALMAADVLTGEATLRFRHPLVRAAVADGLSAVSAAAAHGRAARLLAERGAPAALIAPHLLGSPPAGDQWAVGVLREAAHQAMRQGAPELAARHLQRAVEEAPAGGARAEVLSELGSAEQHAGLPSAPDHMREAIAIMERPADRARAALRLATTLSERLRWREAAEVARAARADAGGADRELDLGLRAILADCVRMDPAAGDDEPEQLRRLAATLSGETRAERLVLASAASMTPHDSAAQHAAAAELFDRSLLLDPDQPGRPETGIVSNFIRAGRLERAELVVERVMEQARSQGLVHRHALMLSMRAWIALERGDLTGAEEDLRDALALTQDIDLSPILLAVMLAVVLVERGEPAAADGVLNEFGVSGPLPEHQVMSPALHFRARVRLAQGRADEALADALEAGRRYERIGLRRAVPPWRSLAAVLLAETGDRARALELAETELDLAERWDTPLARGLALRGLGLVRSDVDLLRAAVEQLDGSPWRLELALAQVDLGAALRRSGRRSESRAPLGSGMDLAHACGAKPLAERARTELLASGARPRRLALSGAGSLTPSERRVCELATSGRTNRQIAQDLFVTTSTVETHLRHAYRKLGLRSRDELAPVLRDSSG